jgi:mono/diheme cytochrome c family protein
VEIDKSANALPARSAATKRAWIGMHAAVGAAILFVACSSGGEDTVSEPAPSATSEPADDTTTSTSDTTTDATTTSTAADSEDAGSSERNGESVAASAISFASDVQPILESNCASCHTADGPGAAHLKMETAGDVDGFDAEYIDAVIEVGFMPPWPAADGDVAFHDDRRLDPADMATVAAWAAAGGELDVDPTTPIEPTRNTRTVIDRDVVLQAEPYKGDTNDPDDYRCQIYDPELTETSWVQGYGIEADVTEVVHHALLFKASADARESAQESDAANPDIGWSCTGLAGFGGRGTVNQILSWAPGQDPTPLPSDTGIEMQPGDFFVMQIHYHYEPVFADLPPDQSTLVVDMADQATIDAAGGELDPIDLRIYLGPAEIPCSTEEVGPLCDRDAAIADLSSRSGTLAGFAAGFLNRDCGVTPEDFADMTTGIASSTCTLPTQTGQIVSIWGHQHEIGKSVKMTLNPGTPEERVLLDIPNWDFDWQLDYRPVEDIVLEQGDEIQIDCVWDRSRIDEDAEPRYVLWAEGTDDEMCYFQIVTRPV